ncbi:S-adenosyl-L-methionine-dependent methyltransferase [Cryphonectria parasitica EP155]|uniref:DNA (cytosine-5-)-methyltransferase n=1 Tax=Cryphonectria parasitica (strain ATCC 38755 / EP155) TaxID=660469 RepID=A0A9P4Y4K0_CRYP1|nr:S-adenosyl-L-methionine-dependent methyltransferase [Cryphonectria parasitica EP155]KAF3766824.1 S-adenosyl-L-methionine-dependent methyltransferase [Cryphonectria parasitica EP155]
MASSSSSYRGCPRMSNVERTTISLSDDDDNDSLYEVARSIAQDEAEVTQELVDLTQDDDGSSPELSSEPHVNPRRCQKSIVSIRGMELAVGDVVELAEHVGVWAIQFIDIQEMCVDQSTSRVLLRGVPYARTKNLRGRLEPKLNEVCRIIETVHDDHRTSEQEMLIEVSANQVLAKRVLIKTNSNFPNCRFGNDSNWRSMSHTQKEEKAPLTCRWEMRIEYQNGRCQKNDRPLGGALIHLSEDDVEQGPYCVSDQQRQRDWRGRRRGVQAKTTGKYTFGDVFCGAGGTSRGAVMAGFEPIVAVDNSSTACQTYQRNFPDTNLFTQDIYDFIHDPEKFYVDVLHISPPCQPYSPIHVREGQNDEANTAALFFHDVLEKTHPRLITLEETFGLTHNKHVLWFNALLRGFTSRHYSIKW